MGLSPEFSSVEALESCQAQITVLFQHGLLNPDERASLERRLQTEPDSVIEEVLDLYDQRWSRQSPLYAAVTALDYERVVPNLRSAKKRISGRGPFLIYFIRLADNFGPLLQMRDQVDKEWREIKDAHLRGDIKPDTIAGQALGETPEDSDFILFAIASFIRTNKSPWHKVLGYVNALYRALTFQSLKFEDFGEKTDFCVDIAFIAYYLAASYGIYGDIESGHGKTGMHHIWRELAPNGRIIDVNACPHVNGFIRDPGEHQKHELLGEKWKTNRDLRKSIESGDTSSN